MSLPTSKQQSKAGHTPGPWKAHRGHGDEPERWCVTTDSTAYFIAVIENGAPGDTLDTEGANAHLIAAAPELLAALKPFTSRGLFEGWSPEEWSMMIETALAAILKAKGGAL